MDVKPPRSMWIGFVALVQYIHFLNNQHRFLNIFAKDMEYQKNEKGSNLHSVDLTTEWQSFWWNIYLFPPSNIMINTVVT